MDSLCLDAVKLTAALVDIESTNPGAYEKNMGDFVENYLKETGMCVKRSVVSGERTNVCGIIEGKISHPALVFICHMDTVVKGAGWTKEAFNAVFEDGMLYGRGSCDMKSGFACALSSFAKAAIKVKEENIIPERNIVFIGTSDEEGDMTGVEKVIEDKWVTKEDYILDGEPTDGMIQMAHKGRTWFELESKGVTAHASMPDKGADAIAGISEMISYIRKEMKKCPEHEELGKSTVTFGMVNGGYSPYVVPDDAKVYIDMRLVPPMNTKKAEEVVNDAIAFAEKEVPGIKGSYRITGDRPPVERYEDSPLMENLKEAVKETTGIDAVVSAFTGYTDTAVIAGKLNNHNCMSYGPGQLKFAHKPDEHVAVCDIERCAKVYECLIRRFLFAKGNKK